ncbi:MAG: NADH:flavin oxidoreductase [Chloroflexi bacterium]|nr:NADH:flavin oxidoreductase [Chloroflexota bacterium]
MDIKFEKLFEPIKIGSLQVKNRIAMGPMGTRSCTHDGYVTDQLLTHYTARAKGGAGLIIVEHTLVTTRHWSSKRITGLWDEEQVTEMGELAEAIHTFGAKAIIQLSLGFGQVGHISRAKDGLVAPSAIPVVIREDSFPRRFPKRLKEIEVRGAGVGPVPRALTTEEIMELEDDFVKAARRAKIAGFDGIEVHGGHGYLIAQFLSPISNARTDLYGGSPENRLRLPLNLIRKTRAVLGTDWVIGYRISADEHFEGGLTLEDSKGIVPVLVGAGLDYVHLSSGGPRSSKWTFPDEEGVIIPEAAAIKSVVSVPVLCPNIYTPQVAEDALSEGKADIVSLARQLLADPEWANKAKAGKIDQIRACTRCNFCSQRVLEGLAIRCPLNPELGLERFNPEYYPIKRKRDSER